MSIFTEQEARAILDKVIKLSKADECTATLSGAESGNIRFALNNVTTSGSVSNASLGVQVAFGKRVGTASINEFDDASLERVVRRAEDLARLAPENPEFVPAIGKQDYKPSATYSESTAVRSTARHFLYSSINDRKPAASASPARIVTLFALPNTRPER